MRKFIKTIACFVIICVHVGIEMYPTGKILAKRYISSIDFKNILNSKPIIGYVSFLEAEEKNKIVSILQDLISKNPKK